MLFPRGRLRRAVLHEVRPYDGGNQAEIGGGKSAEICGYWGKQYRVVIGGYWGKQYRWKSAEIGGYWGKQYRRALADMVDEDFLEKR